MAAQSWTEKMQRTRGKRWQSRRRCHTAGLYLSSHWEAGWIQCLHREHTAWRPLIEDPQFRWSLLMKKELLCLSRSETTRAFQRLLSSRRFFLRTGMAEGAHMKLLRKMEYDDELSPPWLCKSPEQYPSSSWIVVFLLTLVTSSCHVHASEQRDGETATTGVAKTRERHHWNWDRSPCPEHLSVLCTHGGKRISKQSGCNLLKAGLKRFTNHFSKDKPREGTWCQHLLKNRY